MQDINVVMSWLDGLTEDDWAPYHSDSEVQNIAKAALELLENMEEVVRCKDCKNAEVLKWLDNAIICKKHSYNGVRPDEFYCADGERKSDKKGDSRMKWEEIEKQYPDTSFYTNRIKTDIECPKCGKKIYKRLDIVLTSYPAKYQYECECGWIGYAHV